MFDVESVMQDLILIVHSLELGMVNVGLVQGRKADRILNLPDTIMCRFKDFLGYPAHQSAPKPGKELSEITFHNKFGSNASNKNLRSLCVAYL